MKPDIHPEYVETKVTCTCGSPFTTRSTANNGMIHADVCSPCHPFYTGKQKILDTGGRVARFEKRYGKASSTRTGPAGPLRPRGTGAVVCVRRHGRHRRNEEVQRMFEDVERLVDEHARSGGASADPAVHADPANARGLGRRYAELAAVLRDLPRVAAGRRRPGRGA